jgi:Flp pilus assembly protein TadD
MVIVALRPQSPLAHLVLANALDEKKDRDVDGAVAECRKAIEIDPKYAKAHNLLGYFLLGQGHLDEAILAFRTAVECDPKFGIAHSNLGRALVDKDLDEAIAEFHKAIDCDPDRAIARLNLGFALIKNEDFARAVAELRKATDLEPKNPLVRINLASALHGKGDLDEAIAECRKSIDIDPNIALAQNALGSYLSETGHFAEALAHFRRAQELGAKDPKSLEQSAKLIKECEHFLELDALLPAILSGMKQPANAMERIEYANVCQIKHQYEASARLYREAIAAQPDLVASPGNVLRYNAACVAALAGCGKGEDVANLDEQERSRLRHDALDWLKADLLSWGRVLEKDPEKANPAVVRQLQHWLQDSDFNGVRGPDVLAKLPEAERQSWQQLWADVADALAKSQGKAAPKKKPDTK